MTFLVIILAVFFCEGEGVLLHERGLCLDACTGRRMIQKWQWMELTHWNFMWWVVFHQLCPRHKYYTIRFLAFLPDRSLKIRIRAKSRQQPTICHPVTRVGWRNKRLRYKTLVYTFKAKLTGNETRNCYHLILKDVCCVINPFEHVLVPKGVMQLMVLHTGAMKKDKDLAEELENPVGSIGF